VTPAGPGGVLGLDPDELVACVACGLCLPHCPTYRVTGLELASPRGRIAAMRAVEEHGAPLDATFGRAIDECVQCRACEAACPASVPFGHLVEATRAALRTAPGARATRRRPAARLAEAIGLRVVARRRTLRACSWLLLVAQRLRAVPGRLGVPRLTARALRLRLAHAAAPDDADAWLFTGCVMDAWMRPTHAAALRVMAAAGARVAPSPDRAPCCGALHAHAGRLDDARRLARAVVASMPGDAPVVVDSAGCGAAMRDYGRLVGTPDAAAFAARVVDFAAFVTARGVPTVRPTGEVVVVADPCHLRHVQRAHGAVRDLLGGAYALRDTDDDGMCCGAGGAYAALQRDLAGRIRERKIAAIHRAGGEGCLVASANPGCLLHLRAAGLRAEHPADLAAAALDDGGRRG
jgi:glycolate oxidase iron-sulfur subunit